MKNKPQLTNKQTAATGLNLKDNGEIEHEREKSERSRKNDNVTPRH